ncbi:uncharacterized protein B0H18DRAFT_1007530, partial [Fomitopsis serialis]|uniref:uncharacterized protein n=1 Tax=Fomitopsis serialis TaxID=139415 RepID=UPI002007CD6D
WHLSGFELALLARIPDISSAVLTRFHCPGRPLLAEGQRAKARMRLRPRCSAADRRATPAKDLRIERTDARGGRYSGEDGYEDWPGTKDNVAGGL